MDIKKIAKITGAACAAVGIVALSAIVASGAAVGGIAEGFKEAKETVKKVLNSQPKEEEATVVAEEYVTIPVKADEELECGAEQEEIVPQ